LRWHRRENSSVTNASTPGSSPMERAGRKAVLPARVAISTGNRKIEDMRGGLAGGKADVAAEANKNGKEKISRICKRGVTKHRSHCFNDYPRTHSK